MSESKTEPCECCRQGGSVPSQQLADCIAVRVREKKESYRLYNFERSQEEAFATFFDLAQEFTSIESLYQICVDVPKEFFNLDSKLYIIEPKHSQLELVCTSTLGLLPPSERTKHKAVVVEETVETDESWFFPIRGNQALGDMLPFLGQSSILGVLARDKNGLAERRCEGDARRFAIGHEELPRVQAGGVHKGAVESSHARLARFKGYGLQFLHRRTHFNGRGRGRHGFSEAHRDVIGNVMRHLPQEASALEAEDAAPHAVEVHRDDGNLDVLHDALQAATEGKHLAGARDLSFSEDADDLVVAQRVAGYVQRVQHLARMQLARNRDSLHHFGERFDVRGGRKCPGT